eukprot:m.152786 g.152786  ORF g.152786 m.152786 type:complete len:158 (+) comp14272_c2_seq1:306-779(+)
MQQRPHNFIESQHNTWRGHLLRFVRSPIPSLAYHCVAVWCFILSNRNVTLIKPKPNTKNKQTKKNRKFINLKYPQSNLARVEKHTHTHELTPPATNSLFPTLRIAHATSRQLGTYKTVGAALPGGIEAVRVVVRTVDVKRGDGDGFNNNDVSCSKRC